jgi:hypothetical protein
MNEFTPLRLYLLRAMYLLMAVGLGFTFWPLIVAPPNLIADSKTVVRALLGALGLLSLLGVRYPIRMLPLLLFELLWKIIWVAAFAIPLWLSKGLDAYAEETLFACLMGVVLVPIVLPWGYVLRHYVLERGNTWSLRSNTHPVAVASNPLQGLPK